MNGGNLANVLIAKSEPPSEEELQNRKFVTYLNYLTSTCSFFTNADEPTKNLISSIVASNDFRAIGRRNQNDVKSLVRLLRNAWFTETLLRFSHSSPNYLGYTNHWTPVQLYYSVYLELRALMIAMGQTVNRDHTATLHAIGNQVHNRPSLFFAPFCLSLVGTPTKITSCSFNGLPRGIQIAEVSPLSSPYGENCWDHFALFLKTTRDRQVEEGVDRWKVANGKKRIPAVDREKISQKLKPTTFFDALYRLRIRANYQDAEISLIQLEQTEGATRFAKCISTISWFGMLNLELLMCRYIGTETYSRILTGFTKSEKASLSDRLCVKRWELIQEQLKKYNL